MGIKKDKYMNYTRKLQSAGIFSKRNFYGVLWVACPDCTDKKCQARKECPDGGYPSGCINGTLKPEISKIVEKNYPEELKKANEKESK